MLAKSSSFLFFILIGVALLLRSSIFILTESDQAIVTQFGEIRGEPVNEAGLHWKLPFFQDVRLFDKRILSWDGDAEQIPTKDKKYIWVDTTARWRITDARKFAESLHNEQQAKAKLDTILDGITRDTISNHNLVEVVRNTNSILDAIKEKAKEKEDKKKDGRNSIEEEITGEIEEVFVGREQLSQQIAVRSTEELKRFGIELIDVQLRRIAYEKSVEEKVYNRMISERNRIAEKIRSVGKGEEAKISGKLNRDLKKIESEAYRKSQKVRGKAEAESINIYARSLSKDPGYYKFIRTMQAYKKTIPNKAKMILSTDSEFLRMLERKR